MRRTGLFLVLSALFALLPAQAPAPGPNDPASALAASTPSRDPVKPVPWRGPSA